MDDMFVFKISHLKKAIFQNFYFSLQQLKQIMHHGGHNLHYYIVLFALWFMHLFSSLQI